MRRNAVLALSLSIASLALASFATTAHAEPPKATPEVPRLESDAPTSATSPGLPELGPSKTTAGVSTIAPHRMKVAPPRTNDAVVAPRGERLDRKTEVASDLEHPTAPVKPEGAGDKAGPDAARGTALTRHLTALRQSNAAKNLRAEGTASE